MAPELEERLTNLAAAFLLLFVEVDAVGSGFRVLLRLEVVQGQTKPTENIVPQILELPYRSLRRGRVSEKVERRVGVSATPALEVKNVPSNNAYPSPPP